MLALANFFPDLVGKPMGSTQCDDLRKAVRPTEPKQDSKSGEMQTKKRRTNHEKPF